MHRSPVLAAVLATLVASSTFAADRVPVLLELFTSEGCSSCPPADTSLALLDREQPVTGAEIIVLSEHVDYWNRLGWADPFSSSLFSARQEAYSDSFGGNRVYTPQMVVDGQREFIGEATRAVEAVRAAALKPKAKLSLSLVPACADRTELKVTVDGGSLPKGDSPELWVAVAESGVVSKVTRGENAGRTLRHAGVVRQLRPLGAVQAEPGKAFATGSLISLEKSWNKGALKLVAFLQEKKSRRVVGAASIPVCGESR